ncbi:MAG: pilus assembly protein [Alphaproteobacteria bacterium]|jgi:Flp pilus assembly protein TadG|nr:pilus assembly protein [Alphaproteobacteria bacterium]MDP6816279.1 pilus assembly protein [Alphaproteobacteria bacterium]
MIRRNQRTTEQTKALRRLLAAHDRFLDRLTGGLPEWQRRNLRAGVTAIEAALVMPAFLLMCFGIIEVSLMYFVATTLEGQVALASRQVRTGNVQQEGDPLEAFRTLLCSGAPFVDCDRLVLDVRNYGSFGEIEYPEYTDEEGEASNNEFLPGASGDIVLVRISYRWEVTTPFLQHYLADSGSSSKTLNAAAVFQNEPYEGAIN